MMSIDVFPSTNRLLVIILVVLAALLLVLALPASQAHAQQCLPVGLNCTANDLDVHTFVVLPSSPDVVCDSESDFITVDLQAQMQPNASWRYDLLPIVSTDGHPIPGNDNCNAQVLQPIESDGNPFNGTSGVGPFRDNDGDTCGDVASTDGVTYYNMPRLTLPCADPDGNGMIEIPGCFGWTQSAQGGQAITCNSVDDMIAEFTAGTAAKCWCGDIETGITITPTAVTFSDLDAASSQPAVLPFWLIATVLGVGLAGFGLYRKSSNPV
ncbi:MAG: hypothetical protein KDI07_08375 [Anaerolineae bacterium]|nr:hypothetical protein [Anaerolineae bacterium]MCB9133246.1 hypothetical protein [Anaerolineales bacterium]MCB0235586.1 hypothetical protein [Anaerolineae bacterium]MCB0248580.1 hypothetical protein [Anaerolineae bacterium]MCO5244757.1 hypothetical protein [Anaerolineae bacterium]